MTDKPHVHHVTRTEEAQGREMVEALTGKPADESFIHATAVETNRDVNDLAASERAILDPDTSDTDASAVTEALGKPKTDEQPNEESCEGDDDEEDPEGNCGDGDGDPPGEVY